MGTKATDSANNMFSTIGAVQTLVENFPMKLISFGGLNFSTSFDVISILLKILGVEREELIEKITDIICGNVKDTDDGSGFISMAEDVVKVALETNITNILNCSTNPIISNNLLDKYYTLSGENQVKKSGNGILLNVSEIDFTGVLNKSPFTENGSKFYFDVDGYTPSTIYKSKDFNAYLWYIINKSDASQENELIWDDRYKAQKKGKEKTKDIIRCTYIDNTYPNNDKIRIQLCGAREEGSKLVPNNYYKTRKLKKGTTEFALNKTIFEFNHDFLMSIKLYEPKVIVSEIVEYLLGDGNLSINLGFSLNEQIIQEKIKQIINKVITSSDTELNDCFFSFSNDEYNQMLEESEKKRYSIVYNGTDYYEVRPDDILNQLSGITSESSLVDDKTVITNVITDVTAVPSMDPSTKFNLSVNYDWEFELLRALAYPFIRPLFTPKVIFLLLVNKKIMGSLDEKNYVDTNTLIDDLMGGLFNIIKDIIVKLKELILDMLINFVLEKLTPLLSLFASKLLLEALRMYKDLLEDILKNCPASLSIGKWGNNKLNGSIDDVNYADIIPVQTDPNQTMC